jgi:hypothetical protein
MYFSDAGEPEVDEYFLVEADLSTFGGEICTASHLFVILFLFRFETK